MAKDLRNYWSEVNKKLSEHLSLGPINASEKIISPNKNAAESINMEIKVIKTELDEIRGFRILFLHEGNFQFIHNKCHLYGWADTYLFLMDNTKIGYGAVWGKNKREDRDAIFEFYVIKPYRKYSNAIFTEFLSASSVPFIECQTNDRLLSSMVFEHAQNINAEAILFEDRFETDFVIPGAILRKKPAEENANDNDRQYILEHNSEIVSTGGLMLNYNMPYADIYMEVKENFRKQGYGSLIIQELKKEAYLMGRVPAARCNVKNQVSKATLLRTGFKICGYLLNGEIKKWKPKV
jgi:GNAT superfamily N-acetyltransferase